MASDHGDDRARENPLIRGFRGIIIVDRAAGGIGPVDGVPRGPISGICNRGVDSPVVQAGKRARLIDDPREGVGERGVGDTVDDDRADRHLPQVRLAARFGRNDPGKQVDVALSELSLPGGRADAERGQRLAPGDPDGCQPVAFLELNHGFARLLSENTVDISIIKAVLFQLGLYLFYFIPALPHFGKCLHRGGPDHFAAVRSDPCDHRDHQQIYQNDNGDAPDIFELIQPFLLGITDIFHDNLSFCR